MEAASKALAEHEELARNGKLKQANHLTPSEVIAVYLEGAPNGLSFNAAQQEAYRYIPWRGSGIG
jgi:hypothetical protein